MQVRLVALLGAMVLGACTNEVEELRDFSEVRDSYEGSPNPDRNAYFGDLHTHTRYSFDAYLLGNDVSPDDAYRFAKGEAVSDAFGRELQLAEPLDFFAVTDHAIFLGVVAEWADPESDIGKLPGAEPFHGVNEGDMLHPDSAAKRVDLFRSAFAPIATERGSLWKVAKAYLTGHMASAAKYYDADAHQAAWFDIIGAAERHNEPGNFTTFIGYEWTSSTPAPERAAYHRNVIFSGAEAPARPFSRIDSPYPEELWAWMDRLRGNGVDSIAIPHNSNQSNGQVFRTNYSDGRPIDQAFADLRMRNEMLVEITQAKGTSETHPLLSPNDEWADFEIINTRKGMIAQYSHPSGSYVRQALASGIALESERRGNPFKVGFIGSTDNHASASSVVDSAHFGSTPISSTPENRASVPLSEQRKASLQALPPEMQQAVTDDPGGEYLGMRSAQFSASGLAAVWAEENTREAVFAALKRRETYATSGPRIRLRFFGGFGLDEFDLEAPELVGDLYESAVPMGSDLLGTDADTPVQFVLWAERDGRAAPLERLQVIKVWYDGSWRKEIREQVFDVACAGGAQVDPETHRCPATTAGVDLSSCATYGDGAQELRTVWTDPEFDAQVPAAYYARVLENPTCRWSTWDAVKAGVQPREGVAATIQERAWSSPIWYQP